jgi:hypothetical protein
MQARLQRRDERWESGSPLAAGRQSNIVVPCGGQWCQGLKQRRAAKDAAASAALWLVRLDARAGARFGLLGRRRLLWVRGDTAFVLRRAGDEDSLSLVTLASSAAADAVLAKWSFVATLFTRRVSCCPCCVCLSVLTVSSLLFSFSSFHFHHLHPLFCTSPEYKQRKQKTKVHTLTRRLRHVSHPLYLPGTPTISSMFATAYRIRVYGYTCIYARWQCLSDCLSLCGRV